MKTLYILFLSLLVIQPVLAQKAPPLSYRDSIRLARYEDSAFTQNLFSLEREAWLDSALSITPTRAYYWQQKAMPLFKQQKYELGMPYLDSAVKYDKNNHYLEYRAFMKATFSRDYSSALRDFYAIRALNGNSGVMDHPYDFYIGLCHLQLNRLDSAGIYFSRCIERKRKKGGDNAVHYLHWFYLGVVNQASGRQDSAIACLDRSLAQYAHFSDAKYYKAKALQSRKNYKMALSLMEEARKDLKDGYTINEDNAIYEPYPYQLNRHFLEADIRYLQSKQTVNRIMRLPSGDTLKQYYFVLLTKGPRRAEVTDTAIINNIQQGHMDNMGRLAKLGKLKVAGPFGDDGDWRGIFIFDCDTQKEVEEHLATDPAIKAGRLAYEIHPWWTQQGTVIR